MLAAEPIELVLFQLSEKRFALPAHSVLEVLPLIEPTTVPGWPPQALGLIDVRKELIPLLDVSAVLDRAEHPLSPSQYIILLKAFERAFGIVVDRVEGVQSATVPENQTFPSAEVLGVPEACAGVVDLNGQVILLKPEGLFNALGAGNVSARQTEERIRS